MSSVGYIKLQNVFRKHSFRQGRETEKTTYTSTSYGTAEVTGCAAFTTEATEKRIAEEETPTKEICVDKRVDPAAAFVWEL